MKEDSEYWVAESIKDVNFDQKYTMGSELGRGASAVVYCCTHKETQKTWAVKKIVKRPQSRVFTTEIKLLLGLQHENVVRMKEVFETKANIHMILEFAAGGELFDRIVERGSYSERDAAAAFRQIVQGLKYLHENNVIHGDLKPENLLYLTKDEESILKIADFGLSKMITPNIMKMSICGTPSYSAPELLEGKMYDYSADMWSSGVILFILIGGYEPFYAPTDEKIFARILRNQWKFDSPFWDNISSNCKDLVSALLVRDPVKRMSAPEVLKQHWVLGIAAKEEQIVGATERLKSFNARRKLKGAANAVLMATSVMKISSKAED